jgi:hypothetical protein
VPVEVAACVGEALVRQSSGRHRAEPAASVSVGAGETFGGAVEIVAAYARDDAPGREISTWTARPALLATATLGARPAWVRAGLGPALTVTSATWSAPDVGTVTLAEPGARAAVSLGLAVGPRVEARLQLGAGFRASGTDFDALLGVAWSSRSR